MSPGGPAPAGGRALSVIVLAKDEEANLPDLIASIAPLDAACFLVDSGSTDRTVEIARAAGFHVAEHAWQTYAAQRNWAFDTLPIATPWTLCLDADERLTPEAAREIGALVAAGAAAHDGYTLRKRTIFMGRWLKHGGQYPAYHLRLFRTGKGRCEDRLYDQHFVVDGSVGQIESDYIDILTDSLTKWTERHNMWATLEAREMLGLAEDRQQVDAKWRGTPIERKRFLRMKVYRRFPLFVRPFLLFLFDYVVRLGFLDGRPGLIFHVLQRFWFRFLVDAKIYELRRTPR
ncbi:MAG: glycosyltransferase family 2 protein [Thermohalobaculum sp.]|nr:glycosyltransferase family 2 protein [Thermohalobaculum sp.]